MFLGNDEAIQLYLKKTIEKKSCPSFFKKINVPRNEENEPSVSKKTVAENTNETVSSPVNPQQYEQKMNVKVVKSVLDRFSLTDSEIAKLLTADVLENKMFISALQALNISHQNYCNLREEYYHFGIKFRSESKLKHKMMAIVTMENELKQSLTDLSKIKINAAIGLDTLAENASLKKTALAGSIIKLSKLQTMLQDKALFNDLRRRISQQKLTKTNKYDEENFENISFQCMNDLSLSWEEALERIIIDGINTPNPFSEQEVVSLGSMLEDSTAVPVDVILEYYNISKKDTEKVVKQILRWFPVLVIKFDSPPIIVNLWQTEFTFEDVYNYVDRNTNDTDKSKKVRNKLLSFFQFFFLLRLQDLAMMVD